MANGPVGVAAVFLIAFYYRLPVRRLIRRRVVGLNSNFGIAVIKWHDDATMPSEVHAEYARHHSQEKTVRTRMRFEGAISRRESSEPRI